MLLLFLTEDKAMVDDAEDNDNDVDDGGSVAVVSEIDCDIFS